MDQHKDRPHTDAAITKLRAHHAPQYEGATPPTTRLEEKTMDEVRRDRWTRVLTGLRGVPFGNTGVVLEITRWRPAASMSSFVLGPHPKSATTQE